MSDWFGENVLRMREARSFRRVVGMECDPFTDLDGFLQECHNKNPRYAEGADKVRFTLSENMEDWDQDLSDVTIGLAKALHMTHGENVLTGRFDYVIALGGARWSPYDRTAHAVDQILESKVNMPKALVIAGSTRKLGDKEKRVIQEYAPGAETEYDLCVGAQKTILARYADLPIITVCNPDEKSGNDGVIDKVMEEVGGGNGLRIGAVTTQIYHVGLCLDMARAQQRHGWLGFKAAGHCTTPWMKFERSDAVYYSECLTTLRKAAIAFHAGC